MKKRPQLFTLMLVAFALAIALGIGGMAGLYSLAVTRHEASAPIEQSAQVITDERALLESKFGVDPTIPETILPAATSQPDAGDHFRGFISAGLALAAVLLGLATFFSSRVSRPLSRLTHAAQRMASGDMSVRVSGSAVREVNDLSQAFNTMAASIAQADQQRRQLTADVAHELRTPLTLIKGRLEGMQDGVYSPSPEQIAMLLDETAQLERLIEDLRLLALADAGQLPLYPMSMHPASLLNNVAHSFNQQAQAGGVTLQVQLASDLPEMQADPQRISQVLDNLVSNALRYTPPGGLVVMSAWLDGGPPTNRRIAIAVADNGAGIPPEDLPYVFDRFYRADRARSRAGGGAGLGLAISRRIVEAHGGHILAQSAPGKGTAVTFTLPLESAA
jgi:two-component system OmpR family sensor kinase/two-component system sensor histidine kinase BaeS